MVTWFVVYPGDIAVTIADSGTPSVCAAVVVVKLAVAKVWPSGIQTIDVIVPTCVVFEQNKVTGTPP
jgi:hypothetical protein